MGRRILIWHVHGSYLNALVRGGHEYLLPLTPARDGDGGGRLGYPWPASAREVPVEALGDERIDVVILQRAHEAELLARWTGLRGPRRAGDLARAQRSAGPRGGDAPSGRRPAGRAGRPRHPLQRPVLGRRRRSHARCRARDRGPRRPVHRRAGAAPPW